MIIDTDAHVEESQAMFDRQGKIEMGVIMRGVANLIQGANQICYTWCLSAPPNSPRGVKIPL
jgi:hypothetical protein